MVNEQIKRRSQGGMPMLATGRQPGHGLEPGHCCLVVAGCPIRPAYIELGEGGLRCITGALQYRQGILEFFKGSGVMLVVKGHEPVYLVKIGLHRAVAQLQAFILTDGAELVECRGIAFVEGTQGEVVQAAQVAQVALIVFALVILGAAHKIDGRRLVIALAVRLPCMGKDRSKNRGLLFGFSRPGGLAEPTQSQQQ